MGISLEISYGGISLGCGSEQIGSIHNNSAQGMPSTYNWTTNCNKIIINRVVFLPEGFFIHNKKVFYYIKNERR